MLQIIFLNIGLCVILLAIAFVFKKYARVILWSSAITIIRRHIIYSLDLEL